MRARRSCLSVPGSSEKMLAKARTLEADEIIIDLEDSVPADLKVRARSQVCATLAAEGQWRARTVAVRINATTSPWCHRDVIELIEEAGDRLTAFVVPKVEGRADVEFVARLVAMVEQDCGRAKPVGLELLIETATGLTHAHESAGASDRVEALIVGYADLAASLGHPMRDAAEEPADHWHSVLHAVLLAARTAGAQAIDGPYFDIADLDGLRARAQRARSLGYDGKWALHPGQITPLNETFAPTEAEFQQASAVLAELARAEQADGRGAVLLDGEMIDEAMRKQATQVVARGRAAGLDATLARTA